MTSFGKPRMFLMVVSFLFLFQACHQVRPRAVVNHRQNDRVYFETGRVDLSSTAQQIIERKAVFLKRHHKASLLLEGHADARGSEESNLLLGDRRARQVKWQLVQEGADPKRIVVISYGESRPVDPALTAGSYRLNRRVEIVIK